MVEVGSPIADQIADPEKPRSDASLPPALERAGRYRAISPAEENPGAALVENYIICHWCYLREPARDGQSAATNVHDFAV
jgi:hypothetical protein